MRPYVVSRITQPDGTTTEVGSKEVRQVVSPFRCQGRVPHAGGRGPEGWHRASWPPSRATGSPARPAPLRRWIPVSGGYSADKRLASFIGYRPRRCAAAGDRRLPRRAQGRDLRRGDRRARSSARSPRGRCGSSASRRPSPWWPPRPRRIQGRRLPFARPRSWRPRRTIRLSPSLAAADRQGRALRAGPLRPAGGSRSRCGWPVGLDQRGGAGGLPAALGGCRGAAGGPHRAAARWTHGTTGRYARKLWSATMTVGQLFSVIPGAELPAGLAEQPVSHLRLDSRKVGRGDLFFALSGQHRQGREYASAALAAGALAIVSEEPLEGLPTIRVTEARRALALCAAELAGHPDRKLRLVGITGTNGKTTTALLVASVVEARRRGAGRDRHGRLPRRRTAASRPRSRRPRPPSCASCSRPDGDGRREDLRHGGLVARAGAAPRRRARASRRPASRT